MTHDFGRRKTDRDFVVETSEKIGKLEFGYEITAKGFQDVLTHLEGMDKKIDGLRDALYGTGPDHVGLFERVRSLAFKFGLLIMGLSAVSGFFGQWVAKRFFK